MAIKVGIELDEGYFNIAENRIKQANKDDKTIINIETERMMSNGI